MPEEKQEFKGELGDYSLVTTLDGSQTLYSQAFSEHAHSLDGAKSETHFHYFCGCELPKLLKKQSKVRVLEVGFGLGVGYLVTLEEAAKINPQAHITFISTEIDAGILEYLRHNNDSFLPLEKSNYFGIPCYEMTSKNAQLIVLIGKAQETLEDLSEKNPIKVDAIYQDPYSPQKNPDLWAHSFFQILKLFAHQATWLSTYSAARVARENLLSAGWSIFAGERFGKKRDSTRANIFQKCDEKLFLKYSK